MTHIGHVRNKNDDRYIIKELADGSVLMAVADGLGGRVAGDHAAEIVIEKLTALQPEPNNIETRPDSLVKDADLAILEEVEKDISLAGMSTTVTGTLLYDGIAYWVHVGDSRLCVLQGQKLIQITTDHNLAQFLLAQGEITEEEAILELMTVVDLFSGLNKLLDGLQVEMDEKPWYG